MKYTNDKDLNLYLKKLIRTGNWEVKSKNRHLKVVHIASNKSITVPTSPSSEHSLTITKRYVKQQLLGLCYGKMVS
jgi:hypothetical protein